MLSDPLEQRPGHPGDQRVGQLGQGLGAEEPVGAQRAGGPAVGPEQGRAKRLAIPGGQHQAVHLPGQPDRRGPGAGRVDGLAGTGRHRGPPVGRLALRVAGLRRGHGVTGGGLRQNVAPGVHDYRLGRAGPQVKTQGANRAVPGAAAGRVPVSRRPRRARGISIPGLSFHGVSFTASALTASALDNDLVDRPVAAQRVQGAGIVIELEAVRDQALGTGPAGPQRRDRGRERIDLCE